jgi:integrase
LLSELREYWKLTRPTGIYLFSGKTPDLPLANDTVQKACKLAATLARIPKHVTPHTLRHSYATGLLEAGVDLLTISRLLGHSSFMTTMVYLHVRRPHLDSTPSPLDWLPVRQCPRWVDPTQPSPPSASGNPESSSHPTPRPDQGPASPDRPSA